MEKPIPIELKELMKKIVEVFSNPEDLVSLLNGIPADQRAILCLTPFPEHPAFTSLMALVKEANKIGLEPLRALLKGLSPEQRLAACQFASNEERNKGATAFTETFYNQFIETELVNILIEGMSDQQIHTLMQQRGFVTEHPTIDAQTYLAMKKEGFEKEPFKSYAERQNLDQKALLVSAWKNPLVMDDINLGFKTFFKSQKIRPSDFTEEERKDYFLGPQHYLYYALLESSLVSENLIENLEAWLDGFTLEQKRDALNPDGLAPGAGNSLVREAYDFERQDLINYLIELGVPYPKRLLLIELADLVSAVSSNDLIKANDLIKGNIKKQRFELLNTPIADSEEKTLFKLAVEKARLYGNRQILDALLQDLSSEERATLEKSITVDKPLHHEPALKETKSVFTEIIELLSSKNLFKQNAELVNKLKNYPEVDSSDQANSQTILAGLKYLAEKDLLNQKTLSRCLEIALTKGTPKNEWQKAPLFDFEIFETLTKFKDFKIGEKELNILLHMQTEDLRQVNKVVDALNKATLFDENTFRVALERINEKLESPEPVSVVKTSRHETGESRSRLKLNDQIDILPDPDKNARISGGMGTVKKASTADSQPKHYIIKKAKWKDSVQSFTGEDAKKEVAYYHLLGRSAFFYNKKNSPRAIGEWFPGAELNQLREREITNESYETRIRCIASGLTDLNALHHHYRVHGDVSDRNFIIDFENKSMKLIDFGSSHKIGDFCGAANFNYSEPERYFADDIYRDIYAMGVVCAQLFPELYKISGAGHNTKIIQIKAADLTPMEQAVINLIDSMIYPDLKIRCTSEDALSYCNELIKKMDTLSHEDVKEIASATISKITTTVEDVLRKVM